MRYNEITEAGDTWETRHAAFQRQQAKRSKLKMKIANTQAAASDQARTAAAKRAQSSDKLGQLRRDLAATPET